MTIGDVTSTARGSGARYNDGKPALELIPFRVIAETSLQELRAAASPSVGRRLAIAALFYLADFQEGGDVRCLYSAMAAVRAPWRECAAVFEYGRKKYAAWNWAKGMQWSVPMACAGRHLLAMIEDAEADVESGLSHRGHLMCNLVMLATYTRTFPEGDDRPPQLRTAAP